MQTQGSKDRPFVDTDGGSCQGTDLVTAQSINDPTSDFPRAVQERRPRQVPDEEKLQVVSIAAWCAWHRLEDSLAFGAAVRRAIEKSDRKVLVLASGSLSHRFSDDRNAEANIHNWTREFDKQVDMRVVELWKQGRFKEFCAMLPDYAAHCYGEGGMHDTAMLLGLLGGADYDKPGIINAEPAAPLRARSRRPPDVPPSAHLR